MITRIQALNYRCLKYVDQSLGPFHLLVGPNATGKTTFLDVVGLLHDVVNYGPSQALNERTKNYKDLLFGGTGNCFELSVEARIPEDRRSKIERPELDTARYELSLGISDESSEPVIFAEKLLILKSKPKKRVCQAQLFPCSIDPPESIISPKTVIGAKTILNKMPGGNDNFQPETESAKGKRWVYSFKLGPSKSSLGNLPEDEDKFPVATWFRDLLGNGVQRFVLNSSLMKKASPPSKTKGFLTDGSNLPWVVDRLKNLSPQLYDDWINHLQTALPDLEGIKTVKREDDRHCYLVFEYKGGFQIPSWVASDGTLRLLALTLPAYMSDFNGVYLIEEPENGIHPKAAETVFQSLSSVYKAQILLATHSPVILSLIDKNEVEKVLCFAKTFEGATDIITGDKHPKLRDWTGDPNISLLFAGGVLG
jgi:predicted ATPase